MDTERQTSDQPETPRTHERRGVGEQLRHLATRTKQRGVKILDSFKKTKNEAPPGLLNSDAEELAQLGRALTELTDSMTTASQVEDQTATDKANGRERLRRRLLAKIRGKGHEIRHQETPTISDDPWAITNAERYSHGDLEPREEETPPEPVEISNGYDKFGDVSTMRQIREKMGTNKGGVFEDSETETELYVKRYGDPLQTSCEFIANRIYALAGVRVPRGYVIKDGDSIAYATEFNRNLRELTSYRRGDARQLFVPAAYLLDWDAVGTGQEHPYGNLQEDRDTGDMMVVDHGGALFFKGLTGRKSDDSLQTARIAELDTLRSDVNPLSKAIFENLTEEEITQQARKLTEALRDDGLIKEIVAQSRIEDPATVDAMINLLIKRRDVLERKYGTNKTPLILKELQEQIAEKGFDSGFPTAGMLGDSDKIDGNQIDFVQQRDKTAVCFKAAQGYIWDIRDKLSSDRASTDGVYAFQSIDGESIEMADCLIFPIDENTTIFVSKGRKTADDGYTTQTIRSLSDDVRIEVQGLTDIQETTDKIRHAFELMGIPDALTPPDKDTETAYKYEQLEKQHKLRTTADFDAYREPIEEESGVDLIDHLQRKEVLPGYSPVVDEGASKRYLEDGNVYLTHQFYTDITGYIDPARVINAIRGGLYSSHERFKRGINVRGISTEKDFETGGADGVFLHAIPENAPVETRTFIAPTLFFDPQILDRLDWYAYNSDAYGELASSVVPRVSPEEFFTAQRGDYSNSNEIIMNRGIPPEMITRLVYSDQVARDSMVSAFRAAGIEDIRGVSIEDFIQVHSNFEEFKSSLN